MKTKKGFTLREVCGEHIIVAEGKENIDFSKITSLKETAAFLWQLVANGEEFYAEQLIQALTDSYEIDSATAEKDVQLLLNQWKEAGIIDC